MRLVFKGGKPGTYKVYLDNLRLRHADGNTTPIWTGKNRHAHKKDSRHGAFQECASARRACLDGRWRE